jgi:hypothetical protein
MVLDEESFRALLRQRLNSHEWWLFFPMDRVDVLEDIERSFYSGQANADFELYVGPQLPGLHIALAKKSHMSPGMLAGKLGAKDLSPFHDRDIIQFGESGKEEEFVHQLVAFSKWLGPVEEVRPVDGS